MKIFDLIRGLDDLQLNFPSTVDTIIIYSLDAAALECLLIHGKYRQLSCWIQMLVWLWLTEKSRLWLLPIMGRFPTVNLAAESWRWWQSLCHGLRVTAILSAHRWSTVTNHIISCLSTHSHFFSTKLMVKWRKNQWLPLVRNSHLCHVGSLM